MGVSLYTYLPLVVLAIVVARRVTQRSRAPLPPGPKPLPLIGNAHNFPQSRPWLTFAKWKEEYGDVVYANVLGMHTLVLNSRQACIDLLEKRSAIYSDRPYMTMVQDVMGLDWSMIIMPYSVRWRQHRRLFHQYFHEKAARNYMEIQEQCTHNFLRRLARNPEKFVEYTRLAFAEPVLRIVYDLEVKSYQDSHVQLIEKAVEYIVNGAVPGRFLVDLIPILKFVPSWLPGAGFKQFGREADYLCAEASRIPAEYATNRKHESPRPIVFNQMVEKCEQDKAMRLAVDSPIGIAKNTAAVAYMAGSDTTLASVQTFFLAMANHPEVQRAAQAELDSVIGNKRLPCFDDRQDLPYTQAIIKELLRWHPVVPLAIAHRLIEDDIYQGYLIPKGTTILPNLWMLGHDPDIYPDPDTFNPSRWLIQTPEGVKLNDAIPDPYTAFGFGRRICPGRYFALNTLFITVSNVLACFNITPLDESGKPCKRLDSGFSDTLISYPEPFNVLFSPRSDKVLSLLRDLDE